jgi:hypothetical protein
MPLGRSAVLTAVAFLVADLASPLTAAFVGAFLGCLVTLELMAFDIGASIASASATALLCGIFVITRATRYFSAAFFPALYGGTFAGMTSMTSLSNSIPGHFNTLTPALFIALSIICGLTFLFTTRLDTRLPIASGYGGRLGAIAAIASLIFIDLAQRLLGADGTVFLGLRAVPMAPELDVLALTLCVCMAGSLITLFVFRLPPLAKADSPKRISIASTLALSGLAFLSILSPDSPRTLGDFYAGCFLGMSSPERLPGWRQTVFGSVVLTATLTLVRVILPDVGGSLGVAAFFAVALVVGLRRAITITRKVLVLRSRRTEPINTSHTLDNQ